jgi:hypothetical protein
MDQPTLASLLRAGQAGTQSGPVLESPQQKFDRDLQTYLSMGLGGLSLGNAAMGNIPAWAGFGASSAAVNNNAQAPNIQDVWLHQLHQMMKNP